MFKFLKTGFQALFGKPFDEESVEKVLFEADLGSVLVTEFVKRARKNPSDYLTELKQHSLELLREPASVQPSAGTPKVILIVGVNGSGKTTTLAKLAHYFQSQGEKVLIAAGDTFRAAAIEQLELWASRTHTDLVKTHTGADPSGVLFDALSKAQAKGYTTLLVDTSGRLESKQGLMRELEKLHRVTQKFTITPETYLVLDATLGQAALEQAKAFHQFTPLTGIILTKLDGSAKGGMALALYCEWKIPIRFITFGETLDSLAPFDPEAYIDALFVK